MTEATVNLATMRNLIAMSLMVVASSTALAAKRDYVICDNGLRCVTEPCPSTSAYDVKSRRVKKGVWVDTSEMTRRERAEIERYDALYEGTLVIRGEFEDRTVDVMNRPRVLPYLLATEIVRDSTPRERRVCRRR